MNSGRKPSKRPSLSVPGTLGIINDETPTIGRLLAETNLNKPIVGSSLYLTVDSNVTPAPNQQHCGRS
jgi:hypothetical protein